eukprot:GFYU01004622.1.p1 GENE.GFYU01004622.1~~GFYU01004622.1.p1  ORF type:complete len:148 (-),score=54.42 GFYU01004622.1:261-704(-)
MDLKDQKSIADFPVEMESFKQILVKVDQYNEVRLKLQAEMADSSNLVKAYVVKAEDSRMLGDMKLMRRMYANLNDLNRELIMEYNKRSTNHSELMVALKEVNQMIQKAAKLRIGTPKATVVSACRAAIKTNNIHSLFKIIRHGSDAI